MRPSDLTAHVEHDPHQRSPEPLRPRLRLDEETTRRLKAPPTPGRLLAIARWLSNRARQRAHHRRRRLESDRIRLVAEGDSWFNYPFVVDDLVDHLWKDHLIDCVSAPGDTLARMALEPDHLVAVERSRPNLLIVSGGGNDLLGAGPDGRSLLRLMAEGAPRARRGPLLDERLLGRFAERFEANLERLCGEALAVRPGMKALLHGYDYPRPRAGGPLLGGPLEAAGVDDPDRRAAICRRLIDRLNDSVAAVARRSGGAVGHLDLRGAAPADDAFWLDEIHPNSRGFAIVAERFRRRIAEWV
jgi:lysophospholipase L1-like esterase